MTREQQCQHEWYGCSIANKSHFLNILFVHLVWASASECVCIWFLWQANISSEALKHFPILLKTFCKIISHSYTKKKLHHKSKQNWCSLFNVYLNLLVLFLPLSLVHGSQYAKRIFGLLRKTLVSRKKICATWKCKFIKTKRRELNWKNLVK